MLLTVKETASILGEKEKNIYYLIYISRLDAVRVRSDWRICSDSVREEYAKRTGEELHNYHIPGDNGLRRYNELIAGIRTNRIQADKLRRNAWLERRRRMERAEKRRNCVSGKRTALAGLQLEFTF